MSWAKWIKPVVLGHEFKTTVESPGSSSYARLYLKVYEKRNWLGLSYRVQTWADYQLFTDSSWAVTDPAGFENWADSQLAKMKADWQTSRRITSQSDVMRRLNERVNQ